MDTKKHYSVIFRPKTQDWGVYMPNHESPIFVSSYLGEAGETQANEVCQALNNAYEAGLQVGPIPTSTDWYLVVIDEGESGIFTYAVEADSPEEAESKALEDSKEDDDDETPYDHNILTTWNCGKQAPKLT